MPVDDSLPYYHIHKVLGHIDIPDQFVGMEGHKVMI